MRKTRTAAVSLGLAILVSACERTPDTDTSVSNGPRVIAATDIDAGRYVALVGGCNDCHTPLYAQTGGAQPAETEWLKGSTEGHSGPWGTTYGKNLRLTVASLTEDQWVELLNNGNSLPPMPWPSVRALSEADKRALYRYIGSLPGDRGVPSPTALPPGVAPPAP